MADNTPFVSSTDPASPKIADKEVLHAGDQAKVQLIQLAEVTGAEGSHVLRESSFGPNGGLRVEGFGSSGSVKVEGFGSSGSVIVEGGNRILSFQMAIGTTGSPSLDVSGARSLALYADANFDGTQVRFNGSGDNLNFYSIRDVYNNLVIQTLTPGCVHNLFGEVLDYHYIQVVALTPQAGTITGFALYITT